MGSKTTVKKYDAFGVKDSGKQTTYYDASGKELGSVFNFSDSGEQHTHIHTADADYMDYDSNGTIDAKDTDRVYDKPINAETPTFDSILKSKMQTPKDIGFGSFPVDYSLQ